MLTTKKIKIAQSFGSASRSYDVSARLQRYAGKHLMPWLPNRHDLTVIDLGCGTGFFTEILASQFATVFGVDLSTKMLQFASQNRDTAIHWAEADLFQLPFANNSVDLIYSNLVLQWCEPLQLAFDEIFRVLKPGGLLVFSTLLEGTLYELKSSWAQVDNDKHVIDFKSEQELQALFNIEHGSLLEHHKKSIILEYENVFHLAHELKGLGANHVPNKSNKGLAGKAKWQKMVNAYQDFVEPNGIYPATYELFSGLVVKLND